MVAWNMPCKPPSSLCLHELVEESTKRHPERLAIHDHDRKLSYRQLDEATNKLPTLLRETYSITPGDLVPICFEKSSWMIIAILGVLKAGGA
jgi:acyl-CoA synthetase (AMP-forming)/AMP-acid ligase II